MQAVHTYSYHSFCLVEVSFSGIPINKDNKEARYPCSEITFGPTLLFSYYYTITTNKTFFKKKSINQYLSIKLEKA